jgi:hypothetical protein
LLVGEPHEAREHRCPLEAHRSGLELDVASDSIATGAESGARTAAKARGGAGARVVAPRLADVSRASRSEAGE